MAGEFFLPNYGAAPNYSFGLPQLQAPNMQAFSLPNWGTGPVTPQGSFSAGKPMYSVSVPGVQTPDQARLNTLNQQMQPDSFLPYLNVGVQGLSTLGNLYLGWQAMRQAQEASAWQRGMAEKNYLNSVLSYNTGIEDRIRSRYSSKVTARNQGAVDAEVEKYKIPGGAP